MNTSPARTTFFSKVNNAVNSKNKQQLIDLLNSKDATRYPLTDIIKNNINNIFPDLMEGEDLDSVPFEITVAQKFKQKYSNARERGLEFTISFTSMRNMMKAKKCYYTGLPLDKEVRSIDRVDSSKGYIKGNVVACHKDVNQFKAMMESGDFALDYKTGIKMMKKLEDRL